MEIVDSIIKLLTRKSSVKVADRVIALIVTVVILCALAYGVYTVVDRNNNVEQIQAEEKNIENQAENPPNQNVIVVDVKGEVNKPGVYQLAIGSRVNDAVYKAGGFTQNADKMNINLAELLADGVMVVIPSVLSSESVENNLPVANRKININKASARELQNIKGVGEKISERIIEYRNANGPFKSVEDIMNVEGVKKNILSENKNILTVK